MRHLLIALMIALLPVRGWVGDAMALSMLEHGRTAGTTEVAVSAGMDHHPCPDHSATPMDALAAAGAEPADDHQNRAHAHSACDVCNGPAMTVSSPGATTPPASHALLAAHSEPFASTELRHGIKPPIS